MTAIRAYASARDRAWLLALNNQAVPAVNALTARQLGALVAASDAALVAEVDGMQTGALIAFRPGGAYGSTNYRWFEANLDDFLYVDRCVVAAAGRSHGIGTALYRHLFGLAGTLRVPVCCEVNLDPPNPRSLTFHQRLGFGQMTARRNEADGKEVAMLLREDVHG